MDFLDCLIALGLRLVAITLDISRCIDGSTLSLKCCRI